jgi:hypothetical protein
LSNCLIQIGTGEGKSITLAFTAILLTLLGYEVYCVCYSKYLSDRDFDAFKELFQILDLKEFIHYGTFYEICEQIINKHGNLRKIFENFILTNEIQLNQSSNKIQIPKILLIDEVDVFFSKDFYGNDYRPNSNLTVDQHVSNFIDFLWTKKNELKNCSFSLIETSTEYKNLCSKLDSKWKSIIESAALSMISDLSSFQTHSYEIKNDKIGYIEHDDISFNINYGYKTLFAYYLEFEKAKIPKYSLDKVRSIMIKLGAFSLAEIPKIGFKNILGVTGTLETLNSKQKEIIENEYKIFLKTIIPSVYGENKLIFDPKIDVKISNEENYYYKIVEEIKSRIIGRDGEKRAVFVFFENKKELNNFKNYPEFHQFRFKILTEEADLDEKKNIINNSAISNQVVLFTKVFGRGTDFIIHDEIVRKSGIHVIQTFLSDELSEEVQIKGRTARQGEQGSYSIILYDLKLEKYKISKSNLDQLSPNKYYSHLNENMNKCFEDSYIDTIKYVEQLKEKHDLSMDFMKNLENKNKEKLKNYIIKLNEFSNQNCMSKTLILIDATGSMSGLLKKTVETLEIMFDRAFRIINEQKNGSSFSVKISVYRNYNAPVNKLLENSTWDKKADELVKFLRNIEADWGMGNEAIEIGLWQANQEINLSQVILIGDARANLDQEIEQRRNSPILKGTIFEKPTYYSNELDTLIKKDIHVNTVYLKNNKSLNKQKTDIENYQEIAAKSKGSYQYLDLESDNSHELLISLITQPALYSVGGDVLVKAYRNTNW